MRILLAEDISTGGGRTVGYTYDNLNRVVSESASAASGGYDVEYTYDVIGNRTQRIISANGQCMQTDYVINNRDQLLKETHTDPGVCFYLDNKPVYAYTSNGQVSHYRLYGSSQNINPFKAYLLGIPSVWAKYVFRLVLLLLPVIIMMTIINNIVHRRERRERKGLSLAKRLLCVLLCYTVFFSSLGFEQLAQASIDYSELSTANWGTVNRDIHYYYDENGSCIEKIEAVKDEADPDNNFIEKTIYEYNLQNRLSLVKTTTDGVNWDITTYKYDDDGIRVEKNNNGTVTTYLVDSQNHTGFAQVLEEWDTTSTPTLTKTYIIGDDIIGEADDTGDITYLLYDGQGSVRHHSDASGGFVAYSGCDTFAYDVYGQRVDPLKDVINDGLFYTGEMYDSESDQYYLRARYYNQNNGLFNRTDPFSGNLQDPQSLHRYLYCHANPINNIDPSGNMLLGGGSYSLTEIVVISAMMGMLTGMITYHFTGSISAAILVGAAFFVMTFIGLGGIAALKAAFTGATVTSPYLLNPKSWQEAERMLERILHLSKNYKHCYERGMITYRIPDFINKGGRLIAECKWRENVYMSNQLRDYETLAKAWEARIYIFICQGTHVSKSVVELV